MQVGDGGSGGGACRLQLQEVGVVQDRVGRVWNEVCWWEVIFLDFNHDC